MSVVILALLFQISGSSVQILSIDGNPSAYWENAAIVYAEVESIEEGRSRNCTVHLNPIAVLSGKLDPAFQGSISAGAQIWPRHGLIPSYPHKGAKVVALLQWDNFGTYTIPNAIPQFLPGPLPAPMFEVTGFDDPKVTETIENLRKLRGKQREEAEKAKAERKAAAEKNRIEKKDAGKKSTEKNSPPANPHAN